MGSQTLLLAECLFAWTETGSSMAGGGGRILSQTAPCVSLPPTHLPSPLSLSLGTLWLLCFL